MKPCGTVAGTSFFFSIHNDNRCKSQIFAPYKQVLHQPKHFIFFFLTYGSGNKMKCPFVLSDNFLELRCNLEMLKKPQQKCLRFCPFVYISPLYKFVQN